MKRAFFRATNAHVRFGAGMLRGAALVLLAAVLAGTAGCSSDDASGGVGNCPSKQRPSSSLTVAANSEFCADAAPLDTCVPIQSDTAACGVTMTGPTAALERSSTVKEFAGSGAPDVACFSPGGYPAKPGESRTVTVKGVAKIFSHGCESSDLTIEYWTVKRTGGEDDGELDQLVGSKVVTPDRCDATNGVASDKDENCSSDTGTPYHCRYTYEGVPTETELVIKTYGMLWAPLYEYNVYIPNDSVAADDTFEKDVRALASDDYNTISQVAIGSPIVAGHGAIAGEVHDCGDVRLVGAVVEVDVQRKILTYFGDDEDHPLPEVDKTSTSRLGLYAGIDVVPGPVTVAAVGNVDGAPTMVGYYHARVFPDSVTSVTFRGLRPFQVP